MMPPMGIAMSNISAEDNPVYRDGVFPDQDEWWVFGNLCLDCGELIANNRSVCDLCLESRMHDHPEKPIA